MLKIYPERNKFEESSNIKECELKWITESDIRMELIIKQC